MAEEDLDDKNINERRYPKRQTQSPRMPDSPTCAFNFFDTLLDINRFARTLTLKKKFFQQEHNGDPSSKVDISTIPNNIDYVSNRSNRDNFVPFSDICAISVLR